MLSHVQALRPLVLVADDEPKVRATVAEILEAAGFETAAVENGDALVAFARQRLPDAIVGDLETAALYVRADSATRDIPVVVLTDEATPLFRRVSAGIGATAHVLKPIAPEQLVAVVRQVIDQRPGGRPPARMTGSTRTGDHPRATLESLAELTGALHNAVDGIMKTGGEDDELALVAARVDAARVSISLTAPAQPRGGPLSDAAAQWLHALRDATNAICGWVAILRQTHNRAVRLRAAAAIGRNITDLERLLAKLPSEPHSSAPGTAPAAGPPPGRNGYI